MSHQPPKLLLAAPEMECRPSSFSGAAAVSAPLSQADDDDDGIEARFRLQLFALLRNPPHSLARLFGGPESATPQSSVLRLELGRFLAAYYLNLDFAALFANHRALPEENFQNAVVLPNLLLWSQLDDQWQEESDAHHGGDSRQQRRRTSSWNRGELGQLLSADCSPGLAVRILLRERRMLEAIFFADHFNDCRTALALRFLADRTYGTELFPNYCQQLVASPLLELLGLCSEEFQQIGGPDLTDGGSSVEKLIQLQVEAAIQADVLFADHFAAASSLDASLVDNLLATCAELMAEQFRALLGQAEEEDGQEEQAGQLLPDAVLRRLVPLLPRPPIFSAPLDESPREAESQAWLQLHRCFLAITALLSRSNRLDELIGFFALWLAQNQQGSSHAGEAELPQAFESQFFMGQSDKEIRWNLDVFQSLLCAVLGMDLRDRMARLMAECQAEMHLDSDVEERLKKCQQKLGLLAGGCRMKIADYDEEKEGRQSLVWECLKSWAKLADSRDLDMAALFLHSMQQRSQPSRRFLPPLNARSRPKWYSLLLADMTREGRRASNRGDVDQLAVFEADHMKFKLCQPDLLRLRYLASSFPVLPLRPPLIQMMLHLNVDEFCVQEDAIDRPGVQRESAPLMALLEEIRGGENGQQSLPAALLLQMEEKKKKSMEKLANKNDDNNNHGLPSEDEIERLAEQVKASIRRLELLDHEHREKDEASRRREQRAMYELETTTSADPMEEVRGIQRRSAATGRRRWRLETQKSSQQSELDQQDRTFAAFLRQRLDRDEHLLAPKSGRSGSSNTTSMPRASLSSSASYTPTSISARAMGRGGDISASSERESAFESMREEEEEGGIDPRELKSPIPDALLEQEMNDIGRRLEWIWKQFERKKEQLGAEVDDQQQQEAFGSGNGRGIEDGIGVAIAGSSWKEVECIKWIEEEDEDAEAHEASKPVESSSEKKASQVESISKRKMPGKTTLNQVVQQNLEADQTLEADHDQTLAEKIRPTSSVGYHSSVSSAASSAGRTHTLNSPKPGGGEMPAEWLRPTDVEPMDFSRLQIDSDGEEELLGTHNVKRKWSEIEVFPRESPAAAKASSGERKAKDEKATMLAEENFPCPQQKYQQMEDATPLEKKKKKKQWKPPAWLRLLPPFDGAIRTERPANRPASIKRPLLQLRLEGLDSFGTSTGLDASRQTFLDLVAKKQKADERRKKLAEENQQLDKLEVIKSPFGTKMMPKSATKDTEMAQQQQQQANVYDSGIGLDQASLMKWNSNQQIILYSAEMDAEEIEQMRRMAAAAANP